jgi:predicted transcriptional regulator of viral defense system
MGTSRKEQVLALVRRLGVLRSRDLAGAGIPRVYLRRLHAEGVLDNPERGLYVLADAEPGLHRSLAEACKRVPHGVICLLSALQFHGLTTEAPFEVWLAIAESARRPKVQYPPLRVVRFSGAAWTYGIEEHVIEGVAVPVYSPAKTVADCFKYRNKIGLDVALEALRDCWRQRKATMDELYQAAQVCRVGRVIRPYLESLT